MSKIAPVIVEEMQTPWEVGQNFQPCSTYIIGRQDTLVEFSQIDWIQFYFDPFLNQLKMGHSQNFLHVSAPH